MRVAALLGTFTAGSLLAPLKLAVGCGAVLLAEGLALLALMPENARARTAARTCLLTGGLALALAAIAGGSYWRASVDSSALTRYADVFQLVSWILTAAGWLVAGLTVVDLLWGALIALAPTPPKDVPAGADILGPARAAGSTPSRLGRRYAGWAAARARLWPWLDVYATLCMVSLVVAAIQTFHTPIGVRPNPSAGADEAFSFGGLIVFSAVIGATAYFDLKLSRNRAMALLIVASLLSLVQIGFDVVRIVTS